MRFWSVYALAILIENYKVITGIKVKLVNHKIGLPTTVTVVFHLKWISSVCIKKKRMVFLFNYFFISFFPLSSIVCNKCILSNTNTILIATIICILGANYNLYCISIV